MQGPVGQSVFRADAKEKVRGEPIYCGDLSLPHILHGAILRSRYPHARILSVETSSARALPGVAVVAVAADIPGPNLFGGEGDRPILCDDKVRFVGDAVATVAAETAEIAARALKLIDVKYEPLPAVFDAREAMQPEAPRVHDGKDNLVRHFELCKGDVNDAFRRCDVIVENTYETPLVEHAYLETEAAVAIKNPDGTVSVWAGTQFAGLCREHIALMLGLSLEQVRVINLNPGGGFGGKAHEFDCACHAALLSYLSGQPVKLVYDRDESIVSSSKRHAMTIEYKTGATRDGHVQAIQVRMFMNKGAYGGLAIEPGSPIVAKPGAHAAGPYAIPNVRIDVYSVYTNLPFGGAMRGFGVPQVAFAHESQMDALAHQLGMDPVEVRLLNGCEVGSLDVKNQTLDSSVGLKTSIRQVAAKAGWKQFHVARTQSDSGKIRRGMGIAAFMYTTAIAGWPNYANCTMEVDSTGHILVRTGIAEMGQGSRTGLAQIAAEAIGVPLDYVAMVRHGDTAKDPDSMLTVASRATVAAGNAVLRASMEVRQTLAEMAADYLEVPLQQVAQGEDGFRDLQSLRTVPFQELLLCCFKSGRRLLGKGWWGLPKKGNLPLPCSYGAQIVQVAVNIETGEVEVERVVHAQDVGRAVNPEIIRAQMQGAIAMGLGYSLSEELVMNEGYVSNPSFAQYLVPTAKDIPLMDLIIVEDPHPRGPFGAKGVGEPATVPTAAAVANAIYDAVGVRVTELPITAERLWKVLREQGVKERAAVAED